jgi:two-component sensor histidine kinase
MVQPGCGTHETPRAISRSRRAATGEEDRVARQGPTVGKRHSYSRLSAQLAIALAERATALAEADAAKASLALQRNLLSEADHRVRNTLQAAIGLLATRARDLPSEDSRRPLQSAAQQLQLLGEAHRSLSGGSGKIRMGPFLRRIAAAQALATKLAAAPASIKVRVDDVILPHEVAVALGLFAQEAITNAIKHGHGPSAASAITIEFTTTAPRRFRLSVIDDGPGLSPNPSTGMGMKLIEALSRQLKCELLLDRAPGGGAAVSVEFWLPGWTA